MGRGGARSRVGFRAVISALSSRQKASSSEGWHLEGWEGMIEYEKQFIDGMFTERARFFYSAAVPKVELEFKSRGLPMTRGGIVRI